MALRSKNLLLTYPQCQMENEDMMERLKRLIGVENIKYMVVCKEFHQDGAEHHHVFLSLNCPMRFTRHNMDFFDLDDDRTFSRKFHCNIKSCRSPKDAINYVKKNGHFITYGLCPHKECISQKEKNQLVLQKSLCQLVDEGEISIYKLPQLQKAISIYRNERMEVQRQNCPEVRWYYGPTGTGKTRTAIEEAEKEFGKYWKSHATADWFDGYRGEEGVILDDIRSSTWPFQQLLQITDRYYLSLPIKGGFIRWNPKIIWITAPRGPEEIYYNYQQQQPYDGIEQLLRRITIQKEFSQAPLNAHGSDLESEDANNLSGGV